MRDCEKTFIKTAQQLRTPGKNFNDHPEIRHLHTCKVSKIGLIVTPETEKNNQELTKVIGRTCKGHCRKYRR